jgi:hypothetical protein
MTDEEFAAMMQKLGPAGAGLQSPSEIGATYKGVTQDLPEAPSLLSPKFAISNAPVGAPASEYRGAGIAGGRENLNRVATDQPAAQGTTGAIMSVLAPDQPERQVTSPILEKALTESMQYHQERAAQQREELSKAYATLGDLDATDTAKDKAHQSIQNIPTTLNEKTGNLDVVSPVPTQSSLLEALRAQHPEIPADTWTPENLQRVQRDQFVANITPSQTAEGATASRFANLNVGPSARALQDLGIQFPGITGKYATAPVFKPEAPPPPQKIERAQPVPGQTVDAQGNVVKAPASSIGLTTVRGTEFGAVDNPKLGGYTEPNWNVGAWGADISSKTDPFVALPVSILKQYGDPNSSKFESDFNSKYEVQVTDPNTGKVVVAAVRDKGPGAKTGAGIDMGWATREQLGLPPRFSGNIAYRVVPKGSTLPDNTTPSVQQTQANAGGTANDVFTQGATADQVYLRPIDATNLKDPSIHGKAMTTAEIALWARHQANEYADQMAQAGMPLRMDAYQAQYQKFFEGGQKYQEEEKLAPVSPQHNAQFQSLASLVSPDATPEGSQLDTLLKYWNATNKRGILNQGFVDPFSDERKMFESQAEHLLTPIATGIMGMTPGDAGNKNVQEGMMKVLPNKFDSPETAHQKIANLRASVQDQMHRMIQLNKAEHQDTTGLEQQYRKLFVQSKEEAQAKQAAITPKTSAKLDANQPKRPGSPAIRGGPPDSFSP